MYKDFPIYFDTTVIPTPKVWTETSNVVENTQTSEGGTDIVDVTRYDKLSISATIGCLSSTAKVLKNFSKKDSIAVKRYDILTEAYETRNMRMRGFAATKVEKSDDLAVTNALWSVTFTLEEF